MRIAYVKAGLIGLLLFALNEANPYGYYQLLRWVCFGVFSYLAMDAMKRSIAWAWVFAVVALLYNPFVPAALGRGIWEVVNVATAMLLAVSMWKMRVLVPPDESTKGSST